MSLSYEYLDEAAGIIPAVSRGRNPNGIGVLGYDAMHLLQFRKTKKSASDVVLLCHVVACECFRLCGMLWRIYMTIPMIAHWISCSSFMSFAQVLSAFGLFRDLS